MRFAYAEIWNSLVSEEKAMRLGLLGYPLKQSWSADIHEFFIHEDYAYHSLDQNEAEQFLQDRNFDGINVTIPYKQMVIPYLDDISDAAAKMQAVNCIVNRNGKLIGTNTDSPAFRDMLVSQHIEVQGKHIAILGSGGASRALRQAAEELGGICTTVSRTAKENAITYEKMYAEEEKFQIVFNATPVGMMPDTAGMPIDLDRMHHLYAVVDAIANPLRTHLIQEAQKRGLRTASGLEMLVRQAFLADEFFTRKKLDPNEIQKCMQMLLHRKRNIVLIGMPTSGKTSVAGILAEQLHRPRYDMDEEIVKRIGMSISECFEKKGESYFRRIEKETAGDLSRNSSAVIAAGGGAVKDPMTMMYLRSSAKVFLIRRKEELLFGSKDRPLSQNTEAIQKLYAERKPLYEMYSDASIDNNGTLEECAGSIISQL